MNQKINNMYKIILLSFILLALPVTNGCSRDTKSARKNISAHLASLAAKVNKSPESVEAKEAMQEIIGILNGNWGFASARACGILNEKLGPKALPALNDLIAAANCGNGFVRQGAVRAIGAIGPEAAPAIEMLIAKLKAEPGRLGPYAAEALGKIGVKSPEVLQVLEDAALSEYSFLSRYAKKALVRIK